MSSTPQPCPSPSANPKPVSLHTLQKISSPPNTPAPPLPKAQKPAEAHKSLQKQQFHLHAQPCETFFKKIKKRVDPQSALNILIIPHDL
jgi:hypothetical protein